MKHFGREGEATPVAMFSSTLSSQASLRVVRGKDPRLRFLKLRCLAKV